MDALVFAFGLLKGYRTYLAAGAAILTSVASLVGVVDPVNGAAISMAMIAVAQIFHRIASSDHALTLAEIQADISDLVAAIPQPAVAQPATIPMNGPQKT
ncbi:MAG: hypothetical protein WCH39_10285 [Schlesneria sp.]